MATYSKDQIARYLQHIGWEVESQPAIGTLASLQELVKRQLAHVPFESLSLHYSTTHLLSLHPLDLFQKVVGRNMGGYCMENNTFFGTVLRSLGFSVFHAGGRVSDATGGRPGPGYMGLNHMVNLVTIDGQKYLVDVGFGANGPCKPLALISEEETPGIGTMVFKLRYTALPQHTDKAQRVWVFSHRDPNDPSHAGWIDAYSFTEMEFFPEDFAVMNLATMTLRSSFFTHALFAVKMRLDGATGEPTGWLLLTHNQVKKTSKEGVVTLQELRSEADRVGALKKWFDIELTEGEKAGIMGMSSELRG